MMLQPANAPGRAAQGAPPAAHAATAAPGDGAEAPEGAPSPSGGFGGMGMMLLLPLLLFGVIFLMNRGDKKKRAAVEDKLKRGDRVVTRAGFVGKLLEVGEREARIELAPGVNVQMMKSAIEGLYEPVPAGASKDDKSAKARGDKADKDKADKGKADKDKADKDKADKDKADKGKADDDKSGKGGSVGKKKK